MLKNVIFYIFLGGLMYVSGSMVLDYLDAPELHQSWSTKKCVRIVTIKGEHLPCSDKTKFTFLRHVWIK